MEKNDSKLESVIQAIYRMYDCDALENQKRTLSMKCHNELEQHPGLQESLDTTKKGWEYFVLQMALENVC